VSRGKVRLDKRPLELWSVVTRAVEATGPLLEERGHRLDLAVAPLGLRVEADEVRLTQIINNLLSNAARYTPPGGTVTITGARESDAVVLRVSDTGSGIEPALLPAVFEMFVQGARGPDRTEGGLGLGLSLVRTLTQLHGGTVTAHSDGPGRGSEFVVRLPAYEVLAEVDQIDSSVRPAWLGGTDRGRRVLIVDDNRDLARMIEQLLTVAGYETRTANDPSEALAEATAFRPHIAILDIGLPVIDGYTLARELSLRLADAQPILIALTGYSQEQDKMRSREAGFAFHLVKPVDAEYLVQLLNSLDDRIP